MLRIDRVGRTAGIPAGLFSMLIARSGVFLGRSQAGCEQQHHQRQKKGRQYPQCRQAASEAFFRHSCRCSKIDAGYQTNRPTALIHGLSAGHGPACCSQAALRDRFVSFRERLPASRSLCAADRDGELTIRAEFYLFRKPGSNPFGNTILRLTWSSFDGPNTGSATRSGQTEV